MGFGGIPLEIGDRLADKYLLERLLGEGGTGVVVAAKVVASDRPVAIKFLRTALASEEVRTRLEREARAINRITSDHIVKVLDVGALDDGCPYMVMEYLEGRDLARVLKEDGPLSIPVAVNCMMQVCDVLGEAHGAGIVHRDLKPANLFLTARDGAPHVKVVDFGVSKIRDKSLLGVIPKEVTGNYDILGSPRYMAPEQLRNSKDVDARADLWSVGAVLFRLVTGQHAFPGESNVMASVAILSQPAMKLCQALPTAPSGLEAVVERCMSKDVANRYQTAAELVEALAPFASSKA